MKLSDEDIVAMRTEFFDNVKSPELRQRILTIAVAYANESDEENASDMMAWYLSQPENSDKIDELYDEFMGSFPENIEIED